MAFFKSLRSKARKSSTSEVDAAQPTMTTSEFGSNAPPTAKRQASSYANDNAALQRPGSLKASKSKFFSSGSTSRRKQSTSEGPRPPALDAPTSPPALPSMADAAPLAKQTSPSALSTGSAGPPSGGRPSDLFAGKGLAWGELDLTSGGSISKPPQTGDDLQNFLKARRQWVPTFVTDPKEDVEVKQVSKPDDIQFSSNLPEAGTLHSIKDLDESHKRKEKLLGGFEASEGDRWADQATAAATSSSNTAATSRSASTAPTASAKAVQATENQAHATVTKSNSQSRKPAPPRSSMSNGRNGVAAVLPAATKTEDATPAQAAAPIAAPPVAAVLPSQTNNVDPPAPAAPAAAQPAPPAAVRESSDTAGAFATPQESRQQSELGHGTAATPSTQQQGEAQVTEATAPATASAMDGAESKKALNSTETAPKVLTPSAEKEIAAVPGGLAA